MRELPNNILEEVKKLKQVELDSDRKNQVKTRLLSSMQFAPSKKSGVFGTASGLAGLLGKETLRQLSAKPVGIFVIIMGVIVGPGIATVSAARSSLPGDTLYPLKRGLEQVELTFAFTEKSKAEKEINQVAVRLSELHRIAQEQVPSPEREQKIVLALEELKKDTDDVKKRLETAKQTSEQDNAADALAIAKYIEEKTADYKVSLKTSVEQLNVEETDNVEDIELALSTVQEVAIDALDIIAKEHEAGGETLSKEELKTRVESQLATVKQQTESLKGRLALVMGQRLSSALAIEAAETDEPPASESEDQQDVPAAEEAEPAEESGDEEVSEDIVEETETSPEPSSSIDDVIDAISSAVADEVEPQIVFIEELIELGEFRTALNKLTLVKTQVDELTLELRAQRQKMAARESVEAAEKKPAEQPAEEKQTEEGSVTDEETAESESQEESDADESEEPAETEEE